MLLGLCIAQDRVLRRTCRHRFSHSYKIVDVGVKEFMIQRLDFLMRHSPERSQGGPSCIERERPVKHHTMFTKVILRRKGLQIIELKPNEIRREFSQKLCRETEVVRPSNKFLPHSYSGGRAVFSHDNRGMQRIRKNETHNRQELPCCVDD